MGILRSDPMSHGTLVLPAERARHFVNSIGRSVNVQFEDMNAATMARPYKRHVQRLDEMERQMRFLYDEVDKVDGKVTKNNVEGFLINDESYTLESVERELIRVYSVFTDINRNNNDMVTQLNAAKEEKCVCQVAEANMGRGAEANRRVDGSTALLDEGMRFASLGGVITQAEQEKFARALFRATRGNTFTHFESIQEALLDPRTNKPVPKSVFVIYFQGARTSAMHERVNRICQAFGASKYAWPTSSAEARARSQELAGVVTEKNSARMAFEQYVSGEVREMLAETCTGNSLMEDWRLFCLKEKSIYATLNMFEGELTLRAGCWFPVSEEHNIRQLLAAESAALQASAMLLSDTSLDAPPTYIRRTELSGPFQELVDTYGVPTYREANPAVFAIVSFPFIFGIMYGDVFHGTLLFLVGCYGVWKGEALRFSDSSVMRALFAQRYLVFAMGFFAIYAGFLYNDFMSLGMDLFGSRYKMIGTDGPTQFWEPNWNTEEPVVGPGPYPFGLDPAWHGASNELLFVNGLKMKVSVLMGVAQMLLGVALRFMNAIHAGSKVDFFFECVPQLIFMVCFFGYMDFMILYKWVTPMAEPPSIINTLISMGLRQNNPTPLYEGQAGMEYWLMLLTVISVPMLLIPKPFCLWWQNRQSGSQTHSALVDDEAPKSAGGHGGHGEEFDMGELVIHQIIETIEYVLGTISHTASYLRQWALSLAHQQLSLVFWQKTLLIAFGASGPLQPLYVFCAFAVFMTITSGVLLGMDVLECFLHTLRLHWVEFQSKFYKAQGYAFVPFRHVTILSATE